MSITALPEATVHLLGSAQALTTPTSLVKELIDNALDAKATAIDILISQNTIDKIEVRDNGHGIAREDLDALGRRGYTSKLRSFDDLKAIGGISLGFRGEALASAVQLGEVTVTSRTDGDAVATAVKLKAAGGIANESRKSHPIGTTVCVLRFLDGIPVRKQTALKTAPKTLLKVKELLQAYALARPTVRLSLKVAKVSKGSWSFVPRLSEGVKEAVIQVIGRDGAAQCIEKSLVFGESQTRSESHDEDQAEGSSTSDKQFMVGIFCPRSDANPTKIGHGQFISIDARPVSHEKGTMKKIVTIFKRYLKEVFGDNSGVKNPFLRLSVFCPTSSYDPNIEPAKDDVLFEKEYLILEAVEGLFKGIYGDRRPTAGADQTRESSVQERDGFELLLARRPIQQSTDSIQFSMNTKTLTQNSSDDTHLPDSRHSPSTPVTSEPTTGNEDIGLTTEDNNGISDGRRKWGFNMSKDFTEDTGDLRITRRLTTSRDCDSTSESLQKDSSPTATLNPWLIAKMTAPIARRSNNSSSSQYVPQTEDLQPSAPSTAISRHQLPAPGSEPAPTTPIIPRPRRRYSNEVIWNPSQAIVSPPHESRNLPRRRYSNEDISRNTLLSPEPALDQQFIDRPTARARLQNDFVSARNVIVPEDMFMSPPATERPAKRAKKSIGVNKPFVPLRVPDTFRQTTLLDKQHAPNLQEARSQEEFDAELEWAMDYEQRKEEATRRHRQVERRNRTDDLQTDADEVPRSSPHQNRYNSAIRVLEADHISSEDSRSIVEPLRTMLPDGDPRAYLMKQQKLNAVSNGGPLKLNRARSIRLPLEKIPNGLQTHGLLQTLAINNEMVLRMIGEVVMIDSYVSNGSQSAGLIVETSDTTETASLMTKVRVIIEKWMDIEDERRCEVEYDFEKLLKGEGIEAV